MIVPYIGEVTVFAFNFAPAGWLACEGYLLPISEYTKLFSLIGNNFGGDGVSTFGVPNFSSLTEEGGQYCMSLFGTVPTVKRDALPGELALLPYNPPPSWINCDGQLLQISQYHLSFAPTPWLKNEASVPNHDRRRAELDLFFATCAS